MKKFGIFLNILLIGLCVCVALFCGNMLNQEKQNKYCRIAFTANNLEGTVSGVANGYYNNTSVSQIKLNNGKNVSFVESGISLGKQYFSDMSKDGNVDMVKITLTITNKSAYPVRATLALPNYQTNLTFDGSNFIAVLGGTGSTSAVQDMTIEMKLNDKTLGVDFSNILFNINFEKYEVIEGNSVDGYYVTMGSNIVVDEYGVQSIRPVKWIPFAEYIGTGEIGADENGYVAFDNTQKPQTGNKYYFVSEKVLDIGDMTIVGSGLDKSTYTNGVPYNPYANWNNGNDSRPGLTGIDANLYLISNVRELLQGKDAYKSTQEDSNSVYSPVENDKVNLFSEYGLDGYLYNSGKIKSRSATSLNGGAISNDIPNEYKTNGDKLWLLSAEESQFLLNDPFNGGEREKLAAKTFNGNIKSFWWLRSSEPSSKLGVNSFGELTDDVLCFNTIGIRPAFALEI